MIYFSGGKKPKNSLSTNTYRRWVSENKLLDHTQTQMSNKNKKLKAESVCPVRVGNLITVCGTE